MSADAAGRRRLAAAGALALLVALAVVVALLVRGGSSGEPIAERAAELVPADALVYVHLSTDGERAPVRDALKLAEGFPSWRAARDAILARLVVAGEDDGPIDAEAEVGAWLGDEMALALLDVPSGTAQSLVLLAVDDEEAARAFVARGARRSGPSERHRGVRLDRYGAVHAAVVDGFLVLGQSAAVRRAIDLTHGTGEALAREPTFVALGDRLPDDRVADAYATPDGLRRLLLPAGGAYALAGVLLDRPSLVATALALTPGEPGARLVVESRVGDRTAEAFEPRLVDAVPRGALAYMGSQGLDRTATRLLAAAGTDELARLLRRARRTLGDDGAGEVQEHLLGLLREETALVILPGVPAPTMVVIARTGDEEATRAALDRIAEALPRLLDDAEVTREGDALVLRAGGTELHAAVFDGKLAIATAADGIAAARDPEGGLGDEDAFDAVLPAWEEPVTSIVFLDFSQLLRLGEQTGLNDSREYLAVKPDLDRVRSVGASSTGTGEDTSTEIRISIP